MARRSEASPYLPEFDLIGSHYALPFPKLEFLKFNSDNPQLCHARCLMFF